MPSLSVRQIDSETIAGLRIRAAKHGVSMEEEVRRILKQAVSPPDRLGDLAAHLFGSSDDGPVFSLPPREHHEPPEFRQADDPE